MQFFLEKSQLQKFEMQIISHQNLVVVIQGKGAQKLAFFPIFKIFIVFKI